VIILEEKDDLIKKLSNENLDEVSGAGIKDQIKAASIAALIGTSFIFGGGSVSKVFAKESSSISCQEQKNEFSNENLFEMMKNDDLQKMKEFCKNKDNLNKTILIDSYYDDYGEFCEQRVFVKEELPILTVAILNKAEKITDFLINSGADVNLAGTYGIRPTDAAVRMNNLEMLKLLAKKGAKIREISNLRGDFLKLKFCDANLGDPFWVPNFEVVKFLIENGVNPNIKNVDYQMSILQLAAYHNDAKIVELLINQKGIDLNYHTNGCNLPAASSLKIACNRTNGDAIVELLLKKDEINAKNEGVLYSAIEKNLTINTLKLLIEKGADVNSGNPLANAIRYKNFEAVKMLLENSADISVCANDNAGFWVNDKRISLLAYAKQNGSSKEIIEILIKHGATDELCEENLNKIAAEGNINEIKFAFSYKSITEDQIKRAFLSACESSKCKIEVIKFFVEHKNVYIWDLIHNKKLLNMVLDNHTHFKRKRRDNQLFYGKRQLL
jgi:ankyrin repeat protein